MSKQAKTKAKEFFDDSVDEALIKAEIEQLVPLPLPIYLKKRRECASRLKMNVSDIERLVSARKRENKKAANRSAALKADLDELRSSARLIIEHPDILSLFAKEFDKVVAGEVANGKLLYLVATSRLFDKTMSAAIKGTSAGGKSEIRKRILAFFPPEDVVTFTSLSEKSLIYYDGDFSHKVLSMGEATAIDEQEFQDYLLRELLSEGRIQHNTVQKVGNDLEAITIEKRGPVAFLVTTTKSKLHPENETRMLSLEIDDSEDQTRKVLEKVAQVDGLHDIAPADSKPWQDFQRWLVAGERRVVVPFAAVMVKMIPPVAVRLRRDVGQVIRAIKAHALIHRDQRERDEAGQVVADIDRDYDTVCQLMNAIVAEGSGVAVNPATVKTIAAVTEATIGMAEGGASAKDIAKLLKLDKSAARRRLISACNEDLVVNLETRRGMPGKYRTTGQKAEQIAILPKTADLAAHFFSHTPLKPVPPCHREEIPQSALKENGGKPGGKPVAGGNTRWPGGKPVANGLATNKPLEVNADSPPVVGWQGFSGESASTRTDPAVCDHSDAAYEELATAFQSVTSDLPGSTSKGEIALEKQSSSTGSASSASSTLRPPVGANGHARGPISDYDAAIEALRGRGDPVDDDLTIPEFLDRRAEADRVCAQCGAGRPDDLPTVAVRATNGETVYVHEHVCLRFWKKEHGDAHALGDGTGAHSAMSEAAKGTVPPDLVERCKNYAEEMVTRYRNSGDRLTAMPWTRDQLSDDELREWLASRKEAARKIDIAVCEIGAWYHNMNDEYGIRNMLGGLTEEQIGYSDKSNFVRAPETSGWICETDLSGKQIDALYERIHRDK